MSSRQLSEKHGINATIPKCWLCGESKNEILLLGKMKGDIEAPKDKVWNTEPCDKCKEWQGQGIILIGVRDGDEDSKNPHRTGKWVVVKEDYIRRMLDSGSRLLILILKNRYAFVPETAWELFGLPTTPVTPGE